MAGSPDASIRRRTVLFFPHVHKAFCAKSLTLTDVWLGPVQKFMRRHFEIYSVVLVSDARAQNLPVRALALLFERAIFIALGCEIRPYCFATVRAESTKRI